MSEHKLVYVICNIGLLLLQVLLRQQLLRAVPQNRLSFALLSKLTFPKKQFFQLYSVPTTMSSSRDKTDTHSHAAWRRMAFLSPWNWLRQAVAFPWRAAPIQTVPSGRLEPSPSGPARPVTETARAAPLRSRAPCAIARAVSLLTAPCLSSVGRSSPSIADFASRV